MSSVLPRGLTAFAAFAAGWSVGCGANFHEDDDHDDRQQWGQVALPEAWCSGDGDGVIGLDEVVVEPDLQVSATFTVNGPGTTALLDQPGGVEEDGVRVWDLSFVEPDRDDVTSVGPRSLGGRWYEGLYPADAFDALLDGPAGMMGIYRLDEGDQALMLLGVASQEEGDYLVYDPPVPLLRYPLADDDAWAPEDAAAEGVVAGESYPQDLGDEGTVYLVHTYDVEVDGAGVVRLPVGDVDVLRVRIEHRQEAYNSIAGLFAADSSRATMFVAECVGVVARLRSLPDEVAPDFDEASEVLRLGFDPEMME